MDDGAVGAMRKHKSLLPSGVHEVHGVFAAGDVVAVNDVAKIVTGLNSTEIKSLLGRHSSEIRKLLGRKSATSSPGRRTSSFWTDDDSDPSAAAKPCEPPAGIARLLGALRARGIPCRGVDLNLEVMLGILASSVPREGDSTWTARARRGIGRNAAFLGTPDGYADAARYRRAVEDLNRVLAVAAAERGARLSFSDYEEASRSPVRSRDLVDAFRKPEESPLYPWFAPVLERIVREERPAAAGISLSFLSQALPAFAAAGLLRRLKPELKLVLGGSLLTSWMRSPGFGRPFAGTFDHFVAGRGRKRFWKSPGLPRPAGSRARTYRRRVPCRRRQTPPCRRRITGISRVFRISRRALSFPTPRPRLFLEAVQILPGGGRGFAVPALPPSPAAGQAGALAERLGPSLLHFLDNEMSPAFLRALAADPPVFPGTVSPGQAGTWRTRISAGPCAPQAALC